LYFHLVAKGYSHPKTSDLDTEYNLWLERKKFVKEIAKDHEQYAYKVVTSGFVTKAEFWSYSRKNYSMIAYC